MHHTDDVSAATYNYPHFVPEAFEPMMRFESSPALGSKLPSFPLWRATDRREDQLSALLKEHLYTVVELGSFT